MPLTVSRAAQVDRYVVGAATIPSRAPINPYAGLNFAHNNHHKKQKVVVCVALNFRNPLPQSTSVQSRRELGVGQGITASRSHVWRITHAVRSQTWSTLVSPAVVVLMATPPSPGGRLKEISRCTGLPKRFLVITTMSAASAQAWDGNSRGPSRRKGGSKGDQNHNAGGGRGAPR